MIDTLNRALNLRIDKVYDRFHKDLPNFLNQDVFWRSTCHSSYTSEHNIQHSMVLVIMKAKWRVKLVMRKHAEFQGRQLVSI